MQIGLLKPQGLGIMLTDYFATGRAYMRTFSSYGPVDVDLHYHVPRRALVEFASRQLIGEKLKKGGRYITVWAPRQRGKTWVMRQVRHEIEQDSRFDVVSLSVQSFKNLTEVGQVLPIMSRKIQTALSLPSADTDDLIAFETLFSPQTLTKPLILIIDEFDSLQSKVITDLATVFRNIYLQRRDEGYLLHGLALIGVRAVLGVENVSGSPFNVQH